MPGITTGGSIVSGANIVDASISNADIATNAAIDPSKIALTDAIGNAELVDDLVQFRVVSMSAADIMGMFATPFELIPAPGAGKSIIVDQVAAVFTYNSVAFANGNDWSIKEGTTGNSIVAGLTAAQMRGTATIRKVWAKVNDITGFGVNNNITISNPSSAYDTGNSTMKIYLRYRVITL